MTHSLPPEVSSLTLGIFLLPFGDPEARESSLDQLQRSLAAEQHSSISQDQLQRLISSSIDENVDRELSLEELEELRGGIGLVDAMVSSSILMVVVSQSAGLFGNSMSALSNSQLRDGINGAISADIELVRHDVADWARDNSMDGQLRYDPDPTACDAGTLGSALLADPGNGLAAGTTTVSLGKAPTRLQGTTINRTISVDPDNKNLIRISYTTGDSSPIKVTHKTTLATPAQGWCA